MRSFLLILLTAILIVSFTTGMALMQSSDVKAASIVFTIGFFELVILGLIFRKQIFLLWITFVQFGLLVWSIYAFFYLNIHPAISVFLFFAAIMVVLSSLSIKHKSFV